MSIIVAVYKAESYLHRCVDSLLAQTFQDYEILLIDDGSPDKSGKICDEYAKKDNRVRVFHKENGGVSSARQYGIDSALGEYSIHVDPDDWVEPTMLTELYEKAKEDDADMVICDYYEENVMVGSIKHIRQKPSVLNHNTILKELFQHLHGSCWNKLVKHVCYKRYKIEFPLEFSLNEDLYVNMALLRNKLKISYLPYPYYHYLIGANANSIALSINYSEKHYKEDLLKIDMFSDMMKGHNLEMMIKDRMIISLLNRLFEWNELSSYEAVSKILCK